MRKRRLTRSVIGIFAFLIVAFGSVQRTEAAPAYTGFTERMQPDGSTFLAQQKGDEFFHYSLAENGYVIQKDPLDESWKYVYNTDGTLSLGPAAGSAVDESLALVESGFDDISLRSEYYALRGDVYTQRTQELNEVVTLDELPSDGVSTYDDEESQQKTIPLLTIVVGFQNFDYLPDVDWGSRITQGEYSVSAYYDKVSEGKFTFTPATESGAYGDDNNSNTSDTKNDGVVHVKLNRDHGNWGSPDEESKIIDLCDTMQNALEAAGVYVDYSSYDTNGNGALEESELGLLFVMAGYESSSSNSEPAIWAHRWRMPYSASVGGIEIANYTAMGEILWDEGSAEAPIHIPSCIGTICHELGHFLGLPDLYNTDSSTAENGEWKDYDVGSLSLMGGGNWGEATATPIEGERFIPTYMDAYSRMTLGYIEPEVIKQSGEYEVRSIDSEGGSQVYMIETEKSDEIYLVENRQYESFDQGLQYEYYEDYESYPYEYENTTGGIVVWHVDKGVVDAHGIDIDNCVNTADHRPGVMPVFLEGTHVLGGLPLLKSPFWNDVQTQKFPESGIQTKLYNGDLRNDRYDSGISIVSNGTSGSAMKVQVAYPDAEVTTLTSDISHLSTEGGKVHFIVEGEKFYENVLLQVFDQGGDKISDAWATVVNEEDNFTQREFDIQFPENTEREKKEYVVKISTDQGASYHEGIEQKITQDMEVYEQRKLENAVGIILEGLLSKNAALQATGLTADVIANLTKSAPEKSTFLLGYDISVVNSISKGYEGKVTIGFQLPEGLDVQKVFIVHQKEDGTIETFECKVENGKVYVQVDSLSPFALYQKPAEEVPKDPTQPQNPTPTNQPKKPETSPKPVISPKPINSQAKKAVSTGDNSMILVFVLLCLASGAVIFVGVKTRKN